MTYQSEFQNWMFTQEPDGPIVVHDLSKRAVATLEKCIARKALPRAALIAAAPGLYDTLQTVLDVFRVIAQHEGSNPAGLAARDMIPVVEGVLAGADFMGKISPSLLVGR